MTLSDADFRRAEKRMQARLQARPHAMAARYDRRDAKVIVSLSNGLELGVPVRLAQDLSGASTSELADIEISPTGLGLHWPRLDADLYLPALIEGILARIAGWLACWGSEAERRPPPPRKPPPARTAGEEAGLARRRMREAWRVHDSI